MPELSFTAQAPSNIALVKYMGKKDSALNLPENPSLSMTLSSLCTWVELSRASSELMAAGPTEVRWIPEPPRGLPALDPRGQPLAPRLLVPALRDEGVARLRRHVERVQDQAGAVLKKHGVPVRSQPARSGWTLRTANTFPPESGIASSASSFAAITLAVAMTEVAEPEAFERAWSRDESLRHDLAAISRQGSGSSCRSFSGPWVLWDEDRVVPLPSALPKLAHFVVLVSEKPKAVSSSQAHQRVKSSPLWDGRVQRVRQRAERARTALAAGDLSALARTAWSEAWEMHSLFHTSAEPFSYWEPATIDLLAALAPLVSGGQPPIVTLDAGPNVHVTVEESQLSFWRSWFQERFPALRRLEDEPGRGAQGYWKQG